APRERGQRAARQLVQRLELPAAGAPRRDRDLLRAGGAPGRLSSGDAGPEGAEVGVGRGRRFGEGEDAGPLLAARAEGEHPDDRLGQGLEALGREAHDDGDLEAHALGEAEEGLPPALGAAVEAELAVRLDEDRERGGVAPGGAPEEGEALGPVVELLGGDRRGALLGEDADAGECLHGTSEEY